MNQGRIDTIAFIEAIKSGNKSEQNRLYNQMLPALMGYLKVGYNASHDDALDACQQAFLIAIEKLNEGAIESGGAIYGYLRTAAKNEYLRMAKEANKKDDSAEVIHLDQPEDNTEALLEEERSRVLAKCIEDLNSDYQAFIKYIMLHIEQETEKIAKHFKITLNNFWAKKSRVIKQLQLCTQKNLSF